MSSRPQLNPFYAIEDGDMSGSLTSAVTIIQKLSMISYAVSWTGTSPVGTISVEASNDYSVNADGSVDNAGTWNTLPLSAPTAVSGNSGNGMIDIYANSAFAIRLQYARGSGVGTMQVVVTAKVT